MYTYVWEFQVRPDAGDAFHRLYGPDGGWVALFRRAAGYRGTQLLRDSADPLRFLTIDTWESAEAHRAFRERFAAELAELDRAGEALTVREAHLGTFTAIA